jgi:hypothetical protein
VAGLRSLEEVLEGTVLRENVGEGLLHNIVSRRMDEGGILIYLGSGCVSEANRGADLFGLDYFE